jgi:hypothetical protein
MLDLRSASVPRLSRLVLMLSYATQCTGKEPYYDVEHGLIYVSQSCAMILEVCFAAMFWNWMPLAVLGGVMVPAFALKMPMEVNVSQAWGYCPLTQYLIGKGHFGQQKDRRGVQKLQKGGAVVGISVSLVDCW